LRLLSGLRKAQLVSLGPFVLRLGLGLKYGSFVLRLGLGLKYGSFVLRLGLGLLVTFVFKPGLGLRL
jgi:hypothetical protein